MQNYQPYCLTNWKTRKQEPQVPLNFDGAWNHLNELERMKWRDAVNKELKDMENRKVYKIIKRAEMPKDQTCVKSKWVLAEECNLQS